MRRVSTIAAAAGITAALIAPLAGMTGTAVAADRSAGTGGWQPYRTQPFDSTDVCSFTIHGDIVKDEEETRIDATFPDGSAKLQQFRGPLVIRFTNTSSGKSVVRDVSGDALIHFRQDGGSTWFFNGGGSIGVHTGNTATPAGSYIVHGTFVVTFAADGTRDIHLLHATSENLCTTLA
jgi:hypothetical protein